MVKVTFMGAGSTVFAKNVLGDCLVSPDLKGIEIALYDIDQERLADSLLMLKAINRKYRSKATIKTYLGVRNRKKALAGADFVVNAIQVGGYEPCTVTDFEIPKKYGLRQTIADTLGIGGIFRALRTIPVVLDFLKDMEEVCPDALFLNYTNPMAMLSGYMQRYTGVNTVGLCHSVQSCSKDLLNQVGLEDKLEGRKELIAGINHMAWLLEIKDKNGIDLYPEIKSKIRRARDVDCIIIDYLGLMESAKKKENRVQEVTEITRSLKMLAKDLKIPVVCCAQLSRGPEKNGKASNRPMLSDLRDSGSIEQDADIVMMLYREGYYKNSAQNADEIDMTQADVDIAKNRHGPTDRVKLHWDAQYTLFSTLEYRDE